jgi:hypothetical protein
MRNDKVIAYHEAAHAVISLLQHIPVTFASIEPGRDHEGQTRLAVTLGACEPTAWLLASAAGAAAERRIAGTAVHALGDRIADRQLVTALLGGEPSDRRINVRLRQIDALADAAVSAHWDWIERVAHALIKKRRLRGGVIAGLA